MTTNEEVTDFLDRHLDAIALTLEAREVEAMLMDVKFKKWCDDQWGRENCFVTVHEPF